MSDATLNGAFGQLSTPRPDMDAKPHRAGAIAFFAVLLGGLGFAAFSIVQDVQSVGEHNLAIGALVLLGLALVIAPGFEFVNGFHDTANAVATVIYTHTLPPLVAVVWSGTCNLAGVMLSSGTVAYTIVSLLTVELILQVGSGAGYAMIFALLIAAIIWNLGTWAFGLPNSSSHALIGSIIGVGLANQIIAPSGSATSGVDWNQAFTVGKSLLLSPIIGFVLATLLLLAMKAVIRNEALYQAPEGNKPPPPAIRALLVATCSGVSFFHGSNDGQKGMGLIILILIGAAPTAYALNRTIDKDKTPAFLQSVDAGQGVFTAHAGGATVPEAEAARVTVREAPKVRQVNDPTVYAAMATITGDVGQQVKQYGTIQAVPAAATQNVRTDMFPASDAVHVMGKTPAGFDAADMGKIKSLEGSLNSGTGYIPFWVKLSVAIALGLGTMIGWKRIVVTVGEKIGKTHMTYAQGASAEIVAMFTIGLADTYGLPVSTTHVLSSGVAGTMAANGSGLQWATIKNMALAWVMTLPAAMAISGSLYILLRQIF